MGQVGYLPLDPSLIASVSTVAGVGLSSILIHKALPIDDNPWLFPCLWPEQSHCSAAGASRACTQTALGKYLAGARDAEIRTIGRMKIVAGTICRADSLGRHVSKRFQHALTDAPHGLGQSVELGHLYAILVSQLIRRYRTPVLASDPDPSAIRSRCDDFAGHLQHGFPAGADRKLHHSYGQDVQPH